MDIKKKMVAGVLVIVVLALVFMVFFKNSGTIKDGYYTAEMDGFSHGWKEYLRIQVKQGTIMSAEFNAKNESGFIKAWDNSYMKNMNSVQGTYPNKYTREYVQQLVDGQHAHFVLLGSHFFLFHLSLASFPGVRFPFVVRTGA